MQSRILALVALMSIGGLGACTDDGGSVPVESPTAGLGTETEVPIIDPTPTQSPALTSPTGVVNTPTVSAEVSSTPSSATPTSPDVSSTPFLATPTPGLQTEPVYTAIPETPTATVVPTISQVPSTPTIDPGSLDGDGDGFIQSEDCDDTNPDVNDDAIEVCNGRDDDCDGLVDDASSADASTWYPDRDLDSYGAEGEGVVFCSAPPFFVADGQDCDDSDEAINPAADEVCDDLNLDENCNGASDDEDASVVEESKSAFYVDEDTDTYGAEGSEAVYACEAPDGRVDNNDDCDDSDTSFNPSAIEEDCSDPADYNCDGSVGYVDLDGDSWAACQDCDDTDESVNPEAAEVCDVADLDENCNGVADDEDDTVDSEGFSSWYPDQDGDGFADGESGVLACDDPSEGDLQYFEEGSDCNDEDDSIYPGAEEFCNGLNDDCDQEVDESGAVDAQVYYQDQDDDGFGVEGVSTEACGQPDSYTLTAGDCNDGDSDIYPGAAEQCNGQDSDCDTQVDEGVLSTFYIDADADAFGNLAYPTEACTAPNGYVSDSTDCLDTDGTTYPGATELCDESDNDCDDTIDEGATTGIFYADEDGDGYGDFDSTYTACEQPDGYVANAADCDDESAQVNPGIDEVCNDVDDDCDGDIDIDDSGLVDGQSYYEDEDADGYGNPASTVQACELPASYTQNAEDCDDNNPGINPDTIWYLDFDQDGYGGEDYSLTQCQQPNGYLLTGGDCADADPEINPGAQEVCNGEDDDCDELIDDADDSLDEDSTLPWYLDEDGDGYGLGEDIIYTCAQPDSYAPLSDDCNDDDGSIYPGADNVCDGIDNDCDGVIDPEGIDTDGDGIDNCIDPDVWSDDFNDTDFGEWEITDFGGANAPNWIMTGTTFFEGSNSANSVAYGPDLGDMYRYTITLDTIWSGSANNEAAIVFDYDPESGSHYRAFWADPNDYYGSYDPAGRIGLKHCVSKTCQVIEDDGGLFDVSVPVGTRVTWSVIVDVNDISIIWNDIPILTATLPEETPIGAGHVGIYTYDNDGGVSYDNFAVSTTN